MPLFPKPLFLSVASVLALLDMTAQEDLLLQDTVVVEGRRSNPMLADIEPDISLDISEIRSYGAASLEDLLADLEPLTQSARRGAPAILLNGRRVSGLREIRNYPPEALASVEILPEAAALKFGFRADQKVVNFVLRPRFHAVTGRARIGAPIEGGQWLGEIGTSNLRIREDRRWNFDAEYEYEDALFESDRDIESETGETAADRTLLPEKHSLALTASLSDFLPGDVSATYTAGLDAVQQTSQLAQSGLDDTLGRQTDELGAEAGFVLNKTYEDWNWTLNGGLTYRDVQTETETDPVSGFQEETGSETFVANLEAVVFTKLFELPAGDVSTTLKFGADQNDLDSVSDLNGLLVSSNLSRTETNAQVNLDVPILDNGMKNNPLGTLNLNGNARVDNVSDVGTLSSYGAGLTWKPSGSLQILASAEQIETAPELALLGAPISITENARIFDFTTGETIESVTRISGGIPGLDVEERTVKRIDVTFDPFEDPDIGLVFGYSETETENAILTFPGLTPQVEAAFPDRVIRDGDGQLISLDARAFNVAETRSRQIRYGLNWSHQLPQPERANLTQDERVELRGIILRRLDEEDRARVEQRIAEREAQRQAGGQSGRPPGARGGRGGRGGRGSGRIFASLYHTYVLEDSVRIAPGEDALDLLGGDALSDLGGTARHTITAQTGYSKGPVGAFIRGNWRSATEIDDGANGQLKFDDLARVDLRVQYNFGNNPKLLLRYPVLDSTRLALSVSNVFDAKQTVTDAQNMVPITYQPDVLDPQGRVVMLRFRKLFY